MRRGCTRAFRQGVARGSRRHSGSGALARGADGLERADAASGRPFQAHVLAEPHQVYDQSSGFDRPQPRWSLQDLADPAKYDTIRTLAREIDGPLNILASGDCPSVSELQELGVARVSIGGLLSLAAATMVRRAAEELRDRGTYDFANDLIAHPEMNALLTR